MPANTRRTVGILGGMGPAATLDLLQKIIHATPAKSDAEHLNIQVDCNPVPGVDRDSLCERAVRLEKWGVEVIAIACNAAHLHFDAIQNSVQIPVANMIQEATRPIAKLGLSSPKAGILAAPEVLASGLYQAELEERGLVAIAPQESETTALADLIQAVKENIVTDSARQAAIQAGNALIDRGANALILGCTELPLAISQADFSVPVIDATQTLAQAVVSFATGRAPL